MKLLVGDPRLVDDRPLRVDHFYGQAMGHFHVEQSDTTPFESLDANAPIRNLGDFLNDVGPPNVREGEFVHAGRLVFPMSSRSGIITHDIS